jgi:lipoprotein-anchoring transpeptidase ErfK/SrfK
MRRTMVGLGVLVAVLLGAGADAFGEAGGSVGDRTVAPATSGVNDEDPSATGLVEEPTALPESGSSGAAAAAPGAMGAPSPGQPAAAGQGGQAGKPGQAAGKAAQPAKSSCPQGEKQRDVEVALAAIGGYGPVTVDGVQTDADCAAIVKFQQRFGISPANGRAGPSTGDVARRIAASHTPQGRAGCKTGGGLTACVNLTLQTAWVVRDGAVVWGPTVVRTGYRGYATPIGTYKVRFRNIKEWSDPYEVWMPYWQAFNGGIGFHETVSYIHNGGAGSHGCVNLLRSDARSLWGLIGVGTTVYVFGRRPGT